MLGIFKIKKDERLVALLFFVIMVVMEGLMVMYKFDSFSRYQRVGFWSLFVGKLGMSGFDPYAYVVLSDWIPVYPVYRHPVLSVMLYPLSALNHWITPIVGFNCATTIIATIWTLMNTYAYIFMYRVFRIGMEVTRKEAILLCLMLLSLGYVMITMIVPEHMTITFFMLSMMLWLSTRAIKEERVLSRWQTTLMAFFATAVTTTNIAKIGLADIVVHWGRTSWKKFIGNMLTYLIPLTLIVGIVVIQDMTTEKKERQRRERIERIKRQKNPKAFEKQRTEYLRKRTEIDKKQVTDNFLFTYTDTSIDRTESLIHNFFGESLIIHEDHLLEDVYHGRPTFVKYSNPIDYAVEAIIVIMLAAGAWLGRRNRVLLVALSWFAADFFLHIVLSFAINEVYIMTAHWAFIIPLAAASLLVWARKKGNSNIHGAILATTLFVTVYMLFHNATLLFGHIWEHIN